MTNEEKENRSIALQEMFASNGGKILMEHIEDEICSGWEAFIKLPVLEKTSKMAYNYQARYDVLKDLKEWLESEIKLGKQI